MTASNLSGKILYELAAIYLCENFLSAYKNPRDILALYLEPEYPMGSRALSGIYEHILLHAQNKGTGGNAIRSVFGTNDPAALGPNHPWQLRWLNETTRLFGSFDHQVMAQKTIYSLFSELEHLFGLPEPSTSVYMYCLTALQTARFLCQFADGQAFYAQADKNPVAFADQLEADITGIGSGLAADLLKELGYVNFVKADIHIIEIARLLDLPQFKDSKQLANYLVVLAQNDDISPFALDRLLWLIGSLNFFLHQNDVKLKALSRNKHAIASRRQHFADYVKLHVSKLQNEASL